MISTSTVVNSVVEKLRAALKRGQWRRGEMLPGQRELAEQMGISRPSLREAVIVLETLGLVRSMPGKGVVVLETSVSEPQSSDAVADASLEDILQLRYTLEPFIVGLVAQSISSKEVGQLRLTLMDMREALDAEDAEAGMNAYIGFHEELFALTSNPIFQNVVQQTSNALKQSAQVLRNSPEHLAERLRENEAVVRAIRNKNSAIRALEALRPERALRVVDGQEQDVAFACARTVVALVHNVTIRRGLVVVEHKAAVVQYFAVLAHDKDRSIQVKFLTVSDTRVPTQTHNHFAQTRCFLGQGNVAEWKFRAVGQGFNGGLKPLAESFGLKF